MISELFDRANEYFSSYQQRIADAPEWFQKLFGADSLWDLILKNGLQAFGVALAGWLLTTYFERRHITKLAKLEAQLEHISLSTTDTIDTQATEAVLLTGSIVLVHDIFRKLIITIRRIIGGNVILYERLTMRSRRAAIINLKEEANIRGISRIINIRLDTVEIPGRFLSGIALVAYGTGIKDSPSIEARSHK